MHEIGDIPNIPDRNARFDAIVVDCYSEEEEQAAFAVYVESALRTPFAATWRDPDEPGHAEKVTVLDVADSDNPRGVLLTIRRESTGAQRRALADQIYPDDPTSANAIVLDDYRYYRYGDE